jgi:hypothetical protein
MPLVCFHAWNRAKESVLWGVEDEISITENRRSWQAAKPLFPAARLPMQTLWSHRADRIVAVEGRAVKTLDDLLSYIESKKPGDRVSFHIVREGESYEVPVTLVEARK